MEIFIDSGNLDEIKELVRDGIIEGVTTNPTLIKKEVDRLKGNSSVNVESYLKEILRVTKGKRVSLEVSGLNYREIIKEGLILYKKFNKISKNIYIKIPIDPCLEDVCSFEADGIKAIKFLSSKNIPVNCTLIFTPEQAFLAAKAGAKIVSPFVGREDDYIREMARVNFKKEDYFPARGVKKLNKLFSDNGIISGVDLIKQCKKIFIIQNISAEILAASIRNTRQFREVTMAGADIATMPYDLIKQLLRHPKTLEGMKKFNEDVPKEYREAMRK